LTPDEQERVHRVALAALLHDVGKFAQRAEADPEAYRSLSNLHEFAVTDARGQLAYHHAAYTWQFIENHLSWLTRLGDDQGNVAQWAARHHKPSTVWDWIIAEADRLSAGIDRGHIDEAPAGWAAVQGARLTPLLSRIGGEGRPRAFEVPLAPLAMDDVLFPAASRSRSREQSVAEYRTLFGEFTRTVSRIPAGNSETFLETFLSIYERYAWCVPAATNTQPLDVSLFEHSRAAAAIAAALTAELFAEGGLDVDSARDRSRVRYAVAVGDLGGIQRFLYTIVTNRAARALRGRSLALQLLTDAIAQSLIRKLGLPSVSMLYNAGGKIWLLLPASASGYALTTAEEIDLVLHRRYSGRLSFTLGVAPLTGQDFISKKIAEHFEQAASDMQTRRRRRFAALARLSYAEVFDPRGNPANERPCGVCGKLVSEPVRWDDEGHIVCEECRDFEELGAVAVRASCAIRAVGPEWRRRLNDSRFRIGGDGRFPRMRFPNWK